LKAKNAWALPEILNKFVPHWMTRVARILFGAARAIARGIRLLRRRSQMEERLCSLLLSTAERDFPTLAAPFRRD
jgi:hypothetical protein